MDVGLRKAPCASSGLLSTFRVTVVSLILSVVSRFMCALCGIHLARFLCYWRRKTPMTLKSTVKVTESYTNEFLTCHFPLYRDRNNPRCCMVIVWKFFSSAFVPMGFSHHLVSTGAWYCAMKLNKLLRTGSHFSSGYTHVHNRQLIVSWLTAGVPC